MFYSHEILNSRKHGVATIWLVATLGSKSTLRKVSRKAILDVDVPKACETITDADTPMALRLQGNLLFGVSKVFSQQCGYILSDMQGLRDKMRGVSLIMRDLQIDNSVVLTNDQLNLHADPSFNIDMNIGLDLSVFDMASDSTERSSMLSPHSLASTQSSLLPMEEVELQLPQISTTSPRNQFLDFDFEGGSTNSPLPRSEGPVVPNSSIIGDEPAIDENPAFEIGDDGGLIDVLGFDQSMQDNGFLDMPEPAIIQSEAEPVISDSTAPGQVWQVSNDSAFGDDFIDYGGDRGTPPENDPLVPPTNAGLGQNASPSPVIITAEDEKTNTAAEASQQKTRQARVLKPDQHTELSNRQLSEWNHNYLDIMAAANEEKLTRQTYGQAKRNAAFWVLDQGIGGVTVNLSGDYESHPLSVFSGCTLLDALTGTVSFLAGRKRSLSATNSDEQDLHTTQARGTSRQARNILPADEDGIFLQGEDDIESEVGRQPVSSLRDRASSSMPWNLAASSRQSSVREGRYAGIDSSARHGPPSVLSGRFIRITSASPSMGRATGKIQLDSPRYHSDQEMMDLSGDLDDFMGLITTDIGEDFALDRPASMSNSQEAATLENEAYNFFIFLDEQIANKGEQGSDSPSITFERLLPSGQNTNVVAAQGLLHVLALATKGLISIEQEVAFGEIVLKVVDSKQEEDDQGEGSET